MYVELPQQDQPTSIDRPACQQMHLGIGYIVVACSFGSEGCVTQSLITICLPPFLEAIELPATSYPGPSLTYFSGRYWQITDQYFNMVIVFFVCDIDSNSPIHPIHIV